MSGIKETKPLSEIDPEMFALMQNEYKRQTGGLELIASEVSRPPSSPFSLCQLAALAAAAAARCLPLCADTLACLRRTSPRPRSWSAWAAA